MKIIEDGGVHLKEFGHTLVSLGYKIVPIKAGKKYPVVSGWQNLKSTKEDVDAWLANGYAGGGVGILCRETIAVDIDCKNKSVNKKLINWLGDNVGKCSIRVGAPPKCVVPFRVDEAFKKIKSSEYVDSDNVSHQVEILADGQQFVAFGKHPDTGKDYKWSRGDISKIKQKSLPKITKAQAEQFVQHFTELADAAGWVKTKEQLEPQPDNNLYYLRQKMDADDEEIKKMLPSDSDVGYDDWVKVGMALHHHYDGGVDGLNIWNDWSSDGSKYIDGECDTKYQSFKLNDRAPITMATVKAMTVAQEAPKIAATKIDNMLANWAFVQVEGKARVVREDVKKDHLTLYNLNDLKAEFVNQRVLKPNNDPDKKPTLENLVDKWLENPERRTYSAGLTFAPESDEVGCYNLWRGFSYEAKEGNVKPYLDFVLNVVADGNKEHAKYIIAWSAQIIQQPLIKPGVGLVLRGQKGTGKTKFGELLGWLFKPHHTPISKSSELLGNFNKHLLSTLLLQCEEAFWAGAKSQEGALKNLLTNSRIQIEIKGVDSYTANNYSRILFTSNEDFVVPASLDERRFAVFDISNSRRQDSNYFAALDQWYLKEEGAEALLYFLQSFDLSSVDLRAIPKTRALEDQKMDSLDTVNAWLFNCLNNGEIREHRFSGNTLEFGTEAPKSEIYDIYCSSLRSKYDVPVKENTFWRSLKLFDPVFGKAVQRRVGDDRVRMVQLMGLDGARFVFESVTHLKPAWYSMTTIEKDDDPLNPENWEA